MSAGATGDERSGSTSANVRVRIDRLVVDRPLTAGAPALARAVEAELARLLGEQLPGRLNTAGHTEGLAAVMPGGTTSAAGLAPRVARAIHAALGSEPR